MVDRMVVIEQAVEYIVSEYLAAGGKEREMMSRETIKAFFLGMYERDGEEGIKEFLKEWKPVLPKKPVIGYGGVM